MTKCCKGKGGSRRFYSFVIPKRGLSREESCDVVRTDHCALGISGYDRLAFLVRFLYQRLSPAAHLHRTRCSYILDT
jgi:hypothetical protein